MATQHALAALSLLGALLLLALALAAGESAHYVHDTLHLLRAVPEPHTSMPSCTGWLLLWHTTLKDVKFFRELLGVNR